MKGSRELEAREERREKSTQKTRGRDGKEI